jgi:hypothetical protein
MRPLLIALLATLVATAHAAVRNEWYPTTPNLQREVPHPSNVKPSSYDLTQTSTAVDDMITTALHPIQPRVRCFHRGQPGTHQLRSAPCTTTAAPAHNAGEEEDEATATSATPATPGRRHPAYAGPDCGPLNADQNRGCCGEYAAKERVRSSK